MILVRHASEDDLEAYALRTLPEAKIRSLEDHLLICDHCRDRLREMDEYVAARRGASGTERAGRAHRHG